MSMTGGFLAEPKPEHLAHSRISAQFAAQPALQDWAKFMVKYSAPTAARMTGATQKWGDTVQKNQTAYNVAFGTDMPFFDHVGRQEETAALFARYMRSQEHSEGSTMRHILKVFDWAALGEGHVVDVSLSLSHGFVSVLSRSFPMRKSLFSRSSVDVFKKLLHTSFLIPCHETKSVHKHK